MFSGEYGGGGGRGKTMAGEHVNRGMPTYEKMVKEPGGIFNKRKAEKSLYWARIESRNRRNIFRGKLMSVSEE